MARKSASRCDVNEAAAVQYDGAQFVALRRLSTKDDQTLAAPGETCERVPASSLPGLLASGKIMLAPVAGKETE